MGNDNQLTFLNKVLKKVLKNPLPKELEKRIISAAILIPIAVYAICFSQNLFFFIAIVLTIMMTAEWINLIENAQDKQKWQLIGLCYISIPIFCVINIRIADCNILLWMFGVVWATDIFAFFSGKTFGGPKMAPTISPNKTWSGLAGGIIASMIIGLLSSVMFDGSMFFFMFVSALLAVIEQAGDLLESKFKRTFNIKDSGSIIPGHGGILDRLDGLTFVAPTVLLLMIIFSKNFAS